MLHIVVAPNAFKHALDAQATADAIGQGLEESNLSCRITQFPIGDGGDGTCRLIHQAMKGEFINCLVEDPLRRPMEASYSLLKNRKTAVIEMADASGIRLLNTGERNPMSASSIGTGQMIRHALDQGARHIILGMGGSATVDGGCGMLHELGVRFLDGSGTELKPLPKALATLAAIDIDHIDPRLKDTAITILCDVTNKLLGKDGAAAVFGPQKGATPNQIHQLDKFLGRLASIALAKTGKDMTSIVSGGTAGGAAAGMYALTNAKLENGIDFFLQLTGFDEILSDADWVITGEGSLDEQTLGGKGPYGIAVRAKEKGIPVIGLAGYVPLLPSSMLLDTFDLLLPIGNGPTSLEEALKNTTSNLKRTARTIGNLLNR